MKKYLFFLLFPLFFACQKDETDIRDQFIGIYDVTGYAVGEDDSGEYSYVETDVVTVRKGDEKNVLLFNDVGQEHPAILTGATFEMPTFKVVVDDETYEINGAGFFQGDQVQYTLHARAIDFFDVTTITVIGKKR